MKPATNLVQIPGKSSIPAQQFTTTTFNREGVYIPWTAAETKGRPERVVANIRGPQYSAWNGSTGIVFFDLGISFGTNSMQETVVHELAHNWQSTQVSLVWQNWLNASGWRNTAPPAAEAANFTRSGNGVWWYANSAVGTFARELINPADNYSRHSPGEDWTTTWEAYRLNLLGQLNAPVAAALQPKFAILSNFLLTQMSAD